MPLLGARARREHRGAQRQNYRDGACDALRKVAQQTADQTNVPRFRVGVDAIRIDAVVTDRDNRIVEDLTADDFEIKQDGKLQPVTFAQFMPVAVRSAAKVVPKPTSSAVESRGVK